METHSMNIFLSLKRVLSSWEFWSLRYKAFSKREPCPLCTEKLNMHISRNNCVPLTSKWLFHRPKPLISGQNKPFCQGVPTSPESFTCGITWQSHYPQMLTTWILIRGDRLLQAGSAIAGNYPKHFFLCEFKKIKQSKNTVFLQIEFFVNSCFRQNMDL